MTFLLIIHAVFTLVATLLAASQVSYSAAQSILAGSGLSLLNLAALVVTWPLILRKKLFALSIGIIVIKFAILGWILYAVVTGKLFHLGWFAVGMGLVVPSVVATSFKVSQNSLSKADA